MRTEYVIVATMTFDEEDLRGIALDLQLPISEVKELMENGEIKPEILLNNCGTYSDECIPC